MRTIQAPRKARGSSGSKDSPKESPKESPKLSAHLKVSHPMVALGLVLLCGLTLWVRFTGLAWMLPHTVEPDGHFLVQVQHFQNGQEGSIGVNGSKYPHLVSRLAYHSGKALGQLGDSDASAGLGQRSASAPAMQEHRQASSQTLLHLRRTVACLSVCSVPLTFALARLFMGAGGSLLAAALVAFSLLTQSYSQTARPHAAVASTILAAVLTAVLLRRKPSWGRYCLAILGTVLAISTLHNGAVVLLPLIVAHLTRANPKPQHNWAIVGFLLALVMGLVGFYPFWFEGWFSATDNGLMDSWSSSDNRLFIDDEGLKFSAHHIPWALWNGGGIRTVLWTLWSYEPVLLICLFLNLPVLFYRRIFNGEPEFAFPAARAEVRERTTARRRDLRVVWSFCLPYAAVLCAYALTYQRFVLPLVPFLALAAAMSIAGIANLLLPRNQGAAIQDRYQEPLPAKNFLLRPIEFGKADALRFALALIVLAVPCLGTVSLAQLRERPDTVDQAASWVHGNIDRNQLVLTTPNLDLPLLRHPSAWLESAFQQQNRVWPWREYMESLADDPVGLELLYEQGHSVTQMPFSGRKDLAALQNDADSYFEGLGCEYFVATAVTFRRNPTLCLLERGARRAGVRVATFAPERDAVYDRRPFDYYDGLGTPEGQMPQHFLARVLRADCMGPRVDVFLMPSRGALARGPGPAQN